MKLRPTTARIERNPFLLMKRINNMIPNNIPTAIRKYSFFNNLFNSVLILSFNFSKSNFKSRLDFFSIWLTYYRLVISQPKYIFKIYNSGMAGSFVPIDLGSNKEQRTTRIPNFKSKITNLTSSFEPRASSQKMLLDTFRFADHSPPVPNGTFGRGSDKSEIVPSF